MGTRRIISYEEEREDQYSLINSIIEDRFVDEDTIIVNVAPSYSSFLVQVMNHSLSVHNKNQLYEIINLELPSKDMVQVWNSELKEYQLFDKYLYDWVNKHFKANQKYLFVCNTIFTGKHLDKLRKLLDVKMQKFTLAGYNYKIACLYYDTVSVIKPDYSTWKFNGEPPVFMWENNNIK